MSFFAELKRRNVFRVAIAYVVVAWVIAQVTELALDSFGTPDWVMKTVLLLLVMGFPMAVFFAWAFELTPEGIKKEKDIDRSESITHNTGRKLDYIIIGVLVLAIGILLTDRFPGDDEVDAPAANEKSIAVLPFVNISSDEEQEYFSDGITEEILNSLATVKELKVAGRTSSFAFKGKNDDLRKIGDLLGVEHILEGSVRKSGSTVRVTAQLIQVEDGFHLWSETYERELTDIFAIQDEIAAEILKQLKARLLDEEQPLLVVQRTDPEVYDLYLLAKQRLYNRTLPTIENAAELLDQAIAIDPKYAPAYAQRAIATLLLAKRSFGSIPDDEANEQAKRFIETALEIDPQQAEAWAALGLYHKDRPSEIDQAIDALVKALSINPNLMNASHWLQLALSESGDLRGSMQILEHMMQKDPLHSSGFSSAVQAHDRMGQKEKAQALIDQFRSYGTNVTSLLLADASHHLINGSAVDGLRLAEQAYKLAPANAVTHFWVTVGLLTTQQVARISEDGIGYFKVDALDALGHRDDAFDLAFDLARRGLPNNLYVLYNRADRSQDLIDYIDERWPTLDAVAAEHPSGENGYRVMAELALAYSRTGDTDRFDDALLRLEQAMTSLSDQGTDNFIFMYQKAEFLTLAGRHDAAITKLEQVIDRGYQGFAPIATVSPIFGPLRDNPRFIAVEATMIANINRDRQELGLDAIDPLTQFWQ